MVVSAPEANRPPIVAPVAANTTANPANVWIYETVYEWSVPKTAFAAGGGYDSIVISEVHNSPFKTGNPVPIPVLTVSKTSDPISGSDVVGGQTILYTVTVSNPGTVRLTNVVITDAIDSNLTNINPLDGETFDESVVTWPTIPVFGAGATVSVQFEADVKFGLDIAPPTAIFNTGTISPPDLSTDVQTNTTVHFVNGNPSIILSKVADQDVFSAPGTATYTYTITNTGKRAGAEIAQLYVRDLVGSVTRPVQELKGFEKVTLQPGESRTVTFTLRPEDLAFTRQDMSHGWEPGEFRLWIAPSSGADASTPVTFTITE